MTFPEIRRPESWQWRDQGTSRREPKVKGGVCEYECYVLGPLRDFVAAGGGNRRGQPFARRRAQDGEDVKDELDVMTSVSQPARCVLTGEPLMEVVVVEGDGGKTGVVPLAVDGVDVTARLGSKLESTSGQQDVDRSGPLRGEGVGHCDGESKLEGFDVKKDFGYRRPLRDEGVGPGEDESELVQAAPRSRTSTTANPCVARGVGHCEFDGKLEGIDALHDVDHGRLLRSDGVDHSECEGKLGGIDMLKDVDHGKLDGSDVLKDVGYVGPLRGEGVGHGECEVKQEGIDVMQDVDHGPLRGEGVGHGECEVKLGGPGVTKCKLVGIGKQGRPRKKGKAAQATESAAGLRAAGDAVERARQELSLASAECREPEAQLAAARADLAIEEIEVRAVAVELAALGGAWDELFTCFRLPGAQSQPFRPRASPDRGDLRAAALRGWLDCTSPGFDPIWGVFHEAVTDVVAGFRLGQTWSAAAVDFMSGLLSQLPGYLELRRGLDQTLGAAHFEFHQQFEASLSADSEERVCFGGLLTAVLFSGELDGSIKRCISGPDDWGRPSCPGGLYHAFDHVIMLVAFRKKLDVFSCFSRWKWVSAMSIEYFQQSGLEFGLRDILTKDALKLQDTQREVLDESRQFNFCYISEHSGCMLNDYTLVKDVSPPGTRHRLLLLPSDREENNANVMGSGNLALSISEMLARGEGKFCQLLGCSEIPVSAAWMEIHRALERRWAAHEAPLLTAELWELAVAGRADLSPCDLVASANMYGPELPLLAHAYPEASMLHFASRIPGLSRCTRRASQRCRTCSSSSPSCFSGGSVAGELCSPQTRSSSCRRTIR
ncbi:unnamed protein product [Prorocentrum cordatum]|uniref:Poly(ADP-ribose) glycohydrolase n=1 Tax=Prorocentrum cordatum TaxID=2364126 RepID=A0ABN9W6R3_9DINO|nr:unnamed protein product [Polarella glacialis]